MRKTILALALVAGLTSFAGSARAAINLSLDNVTSGTDSGNTYSYSMSKIWDNSQIWAGSYLTIQDSGNTISSVTSTGGTLAGWNGGGIQYVSLGDWTNTGDGYFVTPVNNTFSQGLLYFNVETSGGPLTAGSTFAFILPNDTQYTDATALPVPESASVPEPSQVAASVLLIGGIAGFVIVRRKKASQVA